MLRSYARRYPGGALPLMVFGGILIIGGLYPLPATFEAYQRAVGSASWTEVPARVTGNRIEQHPGTTSDSVYTYRAAVDYAYKVESHTYNGSFDLALSRNLKSQVQHDLEPFPVGGDFAVFYNPSQPGQSVFTRKQGEAECLSTLLMQILSIAGGICSAVAGFRIAGTQGMKFNDPARDPGTNSEQTVV